MQTEIRAGSYSEIICDILGFPIFEDESAGSPSLRKLDQVTRGFLRTALATGEFKAELHRTFLCHAPRGIKAGRLLLIGAGKESEFTPAKLREVAGTLVRRGRTANCRSAALWVRGDIDPSITVRICIEGALYGNYESDIYKTRDREGSDVEKFTTIVGRGIAARDFRDAVSQGRLIGEATNFVRTLANEPSNVLTPSEFALRASEAGSSAGLEVEVLEREEMQKLGMNALLAVARGSDEPPKLVVLRIEKQGKSAKKNSPFYALVGKGVTFDSGGISIKPAERMEDMKADMAGGAAVLGAMLVLARLQPTVRVVGLIPAVENLPSGRAARPGDIVRSYQGKTVEIINTDAEGRLILADALAYARRLGATRLVDIATLTGSCVVALGHINAGMMGTDRETIERLRRNCSITGEKLWELPLDDEYRKAIRSEIADIKNVGSRWGGAITAAKFLQEFTEETPWVHLDIAGVDLDHEGRAFAAKGATGFGVRTLVQLFM